MKFSKILLQAILSGLIALSASAFAGGPADKVTGEFAIVGCYDCVPGDPVGLIRYRYVSAHEAFGRRAQKGFLLSVNDSTTWYEIDFGDSANTCVNIHADGEARIGGLVSDGNAGAVGKYFGYDISDGGQPDPDVYNDTMWVIRFNECIAELPPDGNDNCGGTGLSPKTRFFDWCNGADAMFATHWPQAVIGGNVKVHNNAADGD